MAKSSAKKHAPRELMELVLKEAELSIPEHDDKEDPFVGAIVTNQAGKILSKAHRGELRVGEHCEYTLIERKLRHENLKDCSLYVTLEPCTDEARNQKKGKRGCATHIVKARIAEVFVGIEDPNPKVATEGITFLRENGVTVHMFDSDLQEQIRTKNAKFIKEKEEEAKSVRLEAKAKEKTILEKAPVQATIQNLSNEAIQRFIEIAKPPFTYPSHEFLDWASDFGLVEKENKPTGLGLMLFGERPALLYPQVIFKTEINYGEGESEVKDFSDPLVLQLPKIIDYVKDKALKLTMDRSSAQRREIPDFPIEIVREAIANAIIHRDYLIEGATNSLYVDPEKIIVKSPGTVVSPLSIDDLREFRASSLSRNPKIMYIFNEMKLAEQRGVGMRNMKLLPSRGFPLPKFDMQVGSLVVLFARTQPGEGGAGLSAQEHREWLYIQANEPVARAQFARHFGLPDRTAKDHLVRLIKLKRIKLVGKGKSAKYVSRVG